MQTYEEQAEAFTRTQMESFDEIVMNADTLSFDNVELAGIAGPMNQWRGDGLNVLPTAIAWSLPGFGEEDRREFWKMSVVAGWLPFTFRSREGDAIECRILKVRAGTSLFGKAKSAFRLFRGLNTGRFIFVNEQGSTLKAMWALNCLMQDMGVRRGAGPIGGGRAASHELDARTELLNGDERLR